MEKVKVLYNTIVKYRWTRSSKAIERETPFFEVDSLLKKIQRRSKVRRFYDINGGKFMFLESSSQSNIDNNRILIQGLFKSARHQFRPNLINKINGTERENPRELTEGDVEKTHFSICIDKRCSDVFLLMEYNFYGVSVNNLIDYLKHFNRLISKEEEKKLNYIIQYNTIPKDNFIESLRSLSSVKIAEVTIEKRLLGSNALNFSERLVSVNNELKLTINSSPRESIKNTAIDLFNAFNGGDAGITKVRIKGRDEAENDVILDTSFMNKTSYFNVEKNTTTGELQSNQILNGLRDLILSI